MKYTKIVATISDKRCEPEFIKSLYDAGFNVARLNTAHITPESALRIIRNIRSVSDTIGILIDTKGPEIRTSGILEEGIAVVHGQTVEIVRSQEELVPGQFSVSYKDFVDEIPVGNNILIDDGDIELTVLEKNKKLLVCRVENSGTIKNRKSINTPGISVHLPSITEKDFEFIEFAAQNDVDFIAHSFVRNKEDVIAVQKILDKFGSPIKIIAKIENSDGVNNIDEILDHAYGIMVARGDLGIEIAAEQIPGIQRNLIKKAVQRKKPVIVATQMLHSMIDNPRPTRAEVSDVANAIYSRTDAIMLSGETAYGKYPVEAVECMARIALEIESSKDKRNDIILPPINDEITAFLAESAIIASNELKTKAIVTNTLTGRTARYLAAFRGDNPVYAKCYIPYVVRQLSLSYGVFPSLLEPKRDKFKIARAALKSLVEEGILKNEDTVIYVGGSLGIGGGSTYMEITQVENMTYKNKSDN
ncbi:MAG: pyruvate kinase [Bacteroidetes bacterium GWF2_42_66]|nr:MAG: pyruvate kinase [Bacteroidetes bacterium GWA2_42_15]OFY01350.1 MAG: pyruvate kinase [Bacteroidetes bacterium GWE2_42_39]OFY42194.1 MAG: pyruvate kinase [Bacteroidetes bacterium GWF2_42_66]HBL77591.1 pyruvate kinase [Prolixibacteraceae bacterium]HCB62721.1 pyruvate kinase [Bacteroidales bacterium]